MELPPANNNHQQVHINGKIEQALKKYIPQNDLFNDIIKEIINIKNEKCKALIKSIKKIEPLMEVKENQKKENEKEIYIQTNDGSIKIYPLSNLKYSKLLEFYAENNCDKILLNGIDEKNMELVYKYLCYLRNLEDKVPKKKIPKPFPESTDEEFFKSVLDNFSYDYVTSLCIEKIIYLIISADYLQIDELVDLLAAKLAHEFTNCSLEIAKKKFEDSFDGIKSKWKN